MIPCPCCSQPIAAPSLEIVVDRYDLSLPERKIFACLWRAKGMPVITKRIYDAMYADDPDGGPSHGTAYTRFKVALFRLRNRLQGSGIAIEKVRDGRGYRPLLRDTQLM